MSFDEYYRIYKLEKLNLKPSKVYKDQSLASMDFLPAESVNASEGYHTCDKVMFFSYVDRSFLLYVFNNSTSSAFQ